MKQGEVNLGIDKIRLVFRLMKKDEQKKLRDNAYELIEAKGLVQLTSKHQWYEHAYGTSKKAKKDGTPHLRIAYNPASASAAYMTMDLNLSKTRQASIEDFWKMGETLCEGLSKPFPIMADISFMELFLDVNHPYEDLFLYRKRFQRFEYDHDHPSRTFYLGAEEAPGRVKCYNKKKEMKERKNLPIELPDAHRTRIEFSLRHPKKQALKLADVSKVANPFPALWVFSGHKLRKENPKLFETFPEILLAAKTDKVKFIESLRADLTKKELSKCLTIMTESSPSWWNAEALFQRWIELLPKYKLG